MKSNELTICGLKAVRALFAQDAGAIKRLFFDYPTGRKIGVMCKALAAARRVLQDRPALTFDQLSWPDDAQLSGDDGGVYRASAQLFVNALLSRSCCSTASATRTTSARWCAPRRFSA